MSQDVTEYLERRRPVGELEHAESRAKTIRERLQRAIMPQMPKVAT